MVEIELRFPTPLYSVVLKQLSTEANLHDYLRIDINYRVNLISAY
jgi:hypothetical protein